MENKDEKKKCLKCGKTLKPIGDKRMGGALHVTDWETRKYHKCCYKKVMEERNLKELSGRFNQMSKLMNC